MADRDECPECEALSEYIVFSESPPVPQWVGRDPRDYPQGSIAPRCPDCGRQAPPSDGGEDMYCECPALLEESMRATPGPEGDRNG
jgi:hypothetical protein